MNNVLEVTYGTEILEEIEITLQTLKFHNKVILYKKEKAVGDAFTYSIEFADVEGAFLFGLTRPQIKL